MTEREKAEARWKELQDAEHEHCRFPEFVLLLIILNFIFG